MSPALSTFLFELVNFLLLAGLLGWLLFKPVRAALQARQAAEQKRADDLAARVADADRLHAEWQQKSASFEADSTRVREARLAAAEHEAADIVAAARQTAARERELAVKAQAHIEQAQFDALAGTVAAAARDAVSHLLVAIESPDLESSFVGAACQRLDALDAPSLGAVLVESATPLAEPERARVAAAARNRSTSLTFHVVPELGSGVRITTARGLIDASASGVAAAAERRLKQDLAPQAPPVAS